MLALLKSETDTEIGHKEVFYNGQVFSLTSTQLRPFNYIDEINVIYRNKRIMIKLPTKTDGVLKVIINIYDVGLR